jgi:hypothetical protein
MVIVFARFDQRYFECLVLLLQLFAAIDASWTTSKRKLLIFLGERLKKKNEPNHNNLSHSSAQLKVKRKH